MPLCAVRDSIAAKWTDGPGNAINLIIPINETKKKISSVRGSLGRSRLQKFEPKTCSWKTNYTMAR